MTVRKFHGTDAAEGEEDEAPPIDQYNMSLTYSDFLNALPPRVDEEEDAPGPPTPRPIRRQRSYTHSGSTTSLFGSSASNLPNEFQVLVESTVPLLQNAEVKDQDFVIIAEFSELEGPIPLCTIPEDAPETRTDINLNKLSVHLMSTDYQVNTVGHFKVCEDTQVMRTNVFPHVHVFMQYFTLYDIKARGFVRPFCFGYVSKDHVKLNRNVQTLASEFSRISKVLKCANRLWFAEELSSYMNKLSGAKENFISRTTPPEEEGEDGHLLFETGEQGSDPISLSQIAFQFTEIENILTTVRSITIDTECISELHTLESAINVVPNYLSDTLNKLKFIGDSFPNLNMPLVHPLKQKGETLRPITVLGQVGTLYLVQELMNIYCKHRQDLIFTEMTILTQDFTTHCTMFRPELGTTPIITVKAPCCLQTNEEALCKILEKLHVSVPILPSDDRSGSYHSLSDESDIQFPSGREGSCAGSIENGPSSNLSNVGSVDSNLNNADLTTPTASPSSQSSLKLPAAATTSIPKEKEPLTKKTSSSSTASGFMSEIKELFSTKSSPASLPSPSASSVPRLSLGYSSEEENSQKADPPPVTETSSELELEKSSWWLLAAKTNIVKGDHGYGIWKFFRRFFKIGHHILFSILTGRPVILCASSKFRPRIKQLIFSLVPFVPSYPSKTFKVLAWHQGCLSPLNVRNSYKLIGLCIPERSNVHDLIDSKEQNSVTVLDFEAKKIMGPAYNGNYLKNFEELICQKRFFDDLSVLTYMGSIFAEIESQVFMFKTMQSDGETNVAKIMKQLNLKNSDADIVKHLGSLIAEPHDSVELF